MKKYVHFLSYLAHFLLRREKFQTNVVETIKTHILCSVTVFTKIITFMRNKKYCRAGQATDDNMAHVHYMLDT